jgi:hypothetical protein
MRFVRPNSSFVPLLFQTGPILPPISLFIGPLAPPRQILVTLRVLRYENRAQYRVQLRR